MNTAPVHRCEFVRELRGVRWINDSKATNLDSVEKAILSQAARLSLLPAGRIKDLNSMRSRLSCASAFVEPS